MTSDQTESNASGVGLDLGARCGPRDQPTASYAKQQIGEPIGQRAIDHEWNLREAEGLKAKVPGYCLPIIDEIVRGYRSLL